MAEEISQILAELELQGNTDPDPDPVPVPVPEFGLYELNTMGKADEIDQLEYMERISIKLDILQRTFAEKFNNVVLIPNEINEKQAGMEVNESNELEPNKQLPNPVENRILSSYEDLKQKIHQSLENVFAFIQEVGETALSKTGDERLEYLKETEVHLKALKVENLANMNTNIDKFFSIKYVRNDTEVSKMKLDLQEIKKSLNLSLSAVKKLKLSHLAELQKNNDDLQPSQTEDKIYKGKNKKKHKAAPNSGTSHKQKGSFNRVREQEAKKKKKKKTSDSELRKENQFNTFLKLNTKINELRHHLNTEENERLALQSELNDYERQINELQSANSAPRTNVQISKSHQDQQNAIDQLIEDELTKLNAKITDIERVIRVLGDLSDGMFPDDGKLLDDVSFDDFLGNLEEKCIIIFYLYIIKKLVFEIEQLKYDPNK